MCLTVAIFHFFCELGFLGGLWQPFPVQAREDGKEAVPSAIVHEYYCSGNCPSRGGGLQVVPYSPQKLGKKKIISWKFLRPVTTLLPTHFARFCAICERYVWSLNKHCAKCNVCPSKVTYRLITLVTASEKHGSQKKRKRKGFLSRVVWRMLYKVCCQKQYKENDKSCNFLWVVLIWQNIKITMICV